MTPSQMSHITTLGRTIEIDYLTLVRGMICRFGRWGGLCFLLVEFDGCAFDGYDAVGSEGKVGGGFY
jgi:hypothetical protein